MSLLLIPCSITLFLLVLWVVRRSWVYNLLHISEQILFIVVRRGFHYPIALFAKYWHGYEIHDPHDVISELTHSKCLLIGYHSRPTIDLFYLYCTVPCNIIVTYLLFDIPIFGHFLPLFHVWPSKSPSRPSQSAFFEEILTSIHSPLLLLPGGETECHKAYDQRFQLHWKDVPGFARIICNSPALHSSRVIVFYTKHCEDIFYTTPNWYDYTSYQVTYYMQLYNQTKNLFFFPVLLVWILLACGLCLVPRVIKLDTYYGPVICHQPNETPEAFTARISISLEALIAQVNALPERDFPHGRPNALLAWIITIVLAGVLYFANLIGIVFLLIIGVPVFFVIKQVFVSVRKKAVKQS
jgi:hypothetical protein